MRPILMLLLAFAIGAIFIDNKKAQSAIKKMAGMSDNAETCEDGEEC